MCRQNNHSHKIIKKKRKETEGVLKTDLIFYKILNRGGGLVGSGALSESTLSSSPILQVKSRSRKMRQVNFPPMPAEDW